MRQRNAIIPKNWTVAQLADLGMRRTESVEPSCYPDREFELWSVPAFPQGEPEIIVGAEIGSSKQRVEPGDVLLCKINPRINRVWLVGPSAGREQIASSEWIVFRGHGLDSKFLMLRLRECTFREQLCADVSGMGGSLTRARPQIVRQLKISIPPIAEQRRIVAKIQSLQERSSRARAALAEVGPLLEQFRRSVLSAAFSGRLTAQWRAANPDVEPASELLNRIRTERRQRWEQAELAKYEAKGKKPPKNWKEKYQEPCSPDNSQLPKLPSTWAWARLDALVPQEAPIVYGIILPGPNIPDGVPFVRPIDIRDGTVDVTTLPRTTTEIAQKYQRAALETGDLVFSVVGTIGKSLIIEPELDGANITQSSVRIRPLQPLTAEMLLQVLQSPTLTNQMEHLQFGNAVQRLNVEHMRSLAIPVPPLAEWQEIARRVELGFQSIRTMIHACSSAASDLDQLDQSILAKAFRGELVPQDPSDEPAAELLARIAAAREAAASSSKTSKRVRKPAARKAANP